jgi:hypothetical protein
MLRHFYHLGLIIEGLSSKLILLKPKPMLLFNCDPNRSLQTKRLTNANDINKAKPHGHKNAVQLRHICAVYNGITA